MSQALKGKVALVTGGSRGIGAAIAKRLAADGADVIISYSASPDRAADVVKDIEKSGARGFAIKADQADGKQVETLVTEAVKKFGRLDILVNNAGVYETGAVTDLGYRSCSAAPPACDQCRSGRDCRQSSGASSSRRWPDYFNRLGPW